ncbi:MAG TPA: hypothetical protein PK426_03680 [Spirochaetota bacterium]|nr:hypothetical protein [Spirochaetota bacterium]
MILGFALFILSGCKRKPPVNVEDLEKIVNKYCAYTRSSRETLSFMVW